MAAFTDMPHRSTRAAKQPWSKGSFNAWRAMKAPMKDTGMTSSTLPGVQSELKSTPVMKKMITIKL